MRRGATTRTALCTGASAACLQHCQRLTPPCCPRRVRWLICAAACRITVCRAKSPSPTCAPNGMTPTPHRWTTSRIGRSRRKDDEVKRQDLDRFDVERFDAGAEAMRAACLAAVEAQITRLDFAPPDNLGVIQFVAVCRIIAHAIEALPVSAPPAQDADA